MHHFMLLAILLIQTLSTSAENNSGAPSKQQFDTPITLNELSQTPYYTKIFDQEKTGLPEQFVINLPNAHALGDLGMVVTADKKPFFEYVFGQAIDWKYNVWRKNLLMSALSIANEPQPFNESIALMTGIFSSTYYHWMFDILPRFKLLQLSGLSFDKVYVGQMAAFKDHSLERLGLTHDQIVYGGAETNFTAAHLIIPSVPHLGHWLRPIWVYEFLRNIFLAPQIDEKKSLRKKLYVARKSAGSKYSQRKIVNEKEVRTYLESHGFETVTLDGLPITQQAELFNSASIIVSPHGGALTNLVFCNSQLPVTIIEIIQPSHFIKCYPLLTHQLTSECGFQFNHICFTTSVEKLSEADQNAKNIYVEIAELDKVIAPHI